MAPCENAASILTTTSSDAPQQILAEDGPVGPGAWLGGSGHVASDFRPPHLILRAVAKGEIPGWTDLHALARVVQALQNGMSILARDGVSRTEPDAVTDVAMAWWDAPTARP